MEMVLEMDPMVATQYLILSLQQVVVEGVILLAPLVLAVVQAEVVEMDTIRELEVLVILQALHHLKEVVEEILLGTIPLHILVEGVGVIQR
jgi:hypothetical protein